jgi:hypothetical protein
MSPYAKLAIVAILFFVIRYLIPWVWMRLFPTYADAGIARQVFDKALLRVFESTDKFRALGRWDADASEELVQAFLHAFDESAKALYEGTHWRVTGGHRTTAAKIFAELTALLCVEKGDGPIAAKLEAVSLANQKAKDFDKRGSASTLRSRKRTRAPLSCLVRRRKDARTPRIRFWRAWRFSLELGCAPCHERGTSSTTRF